MITRKSSGSSVISRKTSSRFDTRSHVDLAHLKEDPYFGVHFLTPAQLETTYRTNVETGLSSGIAEEIYQRNGPNELISTMQTSYLDMLRRNLFGWFQCFLWVCASLMFVSYFIALFGGKEESERRDDLFLGIIISSTVLGTGIFGFIQEAKNARLMSGFEKMVPPDAVVIRDGQEITIPCSEVVVGDLVDMAGGELVPADVRILTCTNFQTDMSSITGESKKIAHTPYYTNHNPLESKNMCFFSSPIIEGSARGIVVATGEFTEIGRIAGLVTSLKKVKPPIEKELTHFIIILCIISFSIGILFFILVYISLRNIMSAFHYMLGIILANVPEGLILTLTICMSISAKRLRDLNCLAKTLQAVETLGSTSCICTDKTGTLTENRMSVSHLYFDSKVSDKNSIELLSNYTYNNLCLTASLCLKAEFIDEVSSKEGPQKNKGETLEKIKGDASESAILLYMEKHFNATAVRKANPKVCEIPFSSVYKYHVTIHKMENGGFFLAMKGAPEVLLEFCDRIVTENEEIPMSVEEKAKLRKAWISLAQMGERILGYANLELDTDIYNETFVFDCESRNFPLYGLRFCGLISLLDHPRENIEIAIANCKSAGIRVMMVTGDHPVTALAISRKVGIISPNNETAYDYAFKNNIDVIDVPEHVKVNLKAAVLTGVNLRKMAMNELKEFIETYEEITFARTSPQDKLVIVESCQELGYVVAVTGDGVNDSPALKKADIGIAMGITGTEVAKSAADMILLDDNFASIVSGIEEGRRIWDNLKKTIAYTLTSNTPQMVPFMLYSTIGIPLPLTILQIILINVGTDLLPALSLAYETRETDIMHIPPRKASDHLVTGTLIFMAYFQIGIIQLAAGMYAYFTTMALAGYYPKNLLGAKENWYSKDLHKDAYGVERAYSERVKIEQQAQTSYFFAIVVTQISDVIICKTRRISIIEKGMRNMVLNVGIFVALTAAVVVTYAPVCNRVLGTQPLGVCELLCGVPFAMLMICGDELRRYIIRNNKSAWLEKETYY